MNTPVLIGCALSTTLLPSLQNALAILREKHPTECDGDLLGRILFSGACQVIRQEGVRKEPVC